MLTAQWRDCNFTAGIRFSPCSCTVSETDLLAIGMWRCFYSNNWVGFLLSKMGHDIYFTFKGIASLMLLRQLRQSGSTSKRPKSQIDLQLSAFFEEIPPKRDSDPLAWWKANSSRYPKLNKLAREYLGPPPSSVASERLFSTAGDIVTDARSRLLPERAEQLIFLKVNLPAINFRF